MAWLSEHLGRPSLRESTGQPYRNSLWPILTWHGEERLWPDGIHTIEWFVDVVLSRRTVMDRISTTLAWPADGREWPMKDNDLIIPCPACDNGQQSCGRPRSEERPMYRLRKPSFHWPTHFTSRPRALTPMRSRGACLW